MSLKDYTKAAQTVRANLPEAPSLIDLVRFATLAANAHNTQPWTFRVGENSIDILPDFSRRTPVVDPDDHHLFASLGCATENLVVAAKAHGMSADVQVRENGSAGVIVNITFGKGAVSDVSLCDAIPKRQSTRSNYDGKPLGPAELDALESVACHQSVDVLLLTNREKLNQALGFIQAGNSVQMDNPDFVSELKHWIRFNPRTAIRTGDGLSGPCSGNPSVPDWLGPVLFGFVFKKAAENRKLASQIATSAGLAVFIAKEDTPRGWIEVGRCFERFALTATAMGIRHAHVNMPIEVASIRPDFARWLGIPGRRPDLIVRFGKADPMPMSLRRPVEDVIDIV